MQAGSENIGVKHDLMFDEISRGVLDVEPLLPLLVSSLQLADRLGEVSPHMLKFLSVMPIPSKVSLAVISLSLSPPN